MLAENFEPSKSISKKEQPGNPSVSLDVWGKPSAKNRREPIEIAENPNPYAPVSTGDVRTAIETRVDEGLKAIKPSPCLEPGELNHLKNLATHLFAGNWTDLARTGEAMRAKNIAGLSDGSQDAVNDCLNRIFNQNTGGAADENDGYTVNSKLGYTVTCQPINVTGCDSYMYVFGGQGAPVLKEGKKVYHLSFNPRGDNGWGWVDVDNKCKPLAGYIPDASKVKAFTTAFQEKFKKHWAEDHPVAAPVPQPLEVRDSLKDQRRNTFDAELAKLYPTDPTNRRSREDNEIIRKELLNVFDRGYALTYASLMEINNEHPDPQNMPRLVTLLQELAKKDPLFPNDLKNRLMPVLVSMPAHVEATKPDAESILPNGGALNHHNHLVDQLQRSRPTPEKRAALEAEFKAVSKAIRVFADPGPSFDEHIEKACFAYVKARLEAPGKVLPEEQEAALVKKLKDALKQEREAAASKAEK